MLLIENSEYKRGERFMYYVLMKNFIKNWKDYVLLLICNVIIFGFVVTGFGMQEILSGLASYQGLGMFSGVTTILLNALIPMAIISVIIIVILYFYYMKCRAKNNGILLMLGMRRKNLYGFVALELISVAVISMIIGSVLGTALINIFIKYINIILGENIGLLAISLKTYFKAILAISLLYLTSVITSSTILSDFNVGRTTDLRAIREKILDRFHIIFIPMGLAALGYCLFSYSRIYRYENMLLLFGAFIGLLLIVLFGSAKFLLSERKKTQYLKKLLLHNQLFHKSKTNSAFIYSIILIQTCVLFYFPVQGISSLIAKDVDELFPYDIVCIADDGDDEFFEELQNEYEMTMVQYPMVRVVSYDSTERREQGFTSFYLERNCENKDEWTIHNLKQLIDFVERLL